MRETPRSIAKMLNHSEYEGKPCKNCGSTKKRTINSACIKCLSIKRKEYDKKYSKEWAKNNKEKINEAARIYRKNNPEKAAAATKKWRQMNKDKISKYSKEYYSENKEKIIKRVLSKQYTNRWKRAMNRAKQRAVKMERLPSDSKNNIEKISRVYLESEIISLITGIPHEVDHVLPLCHPTSPGLHVYENLQIVTRAYNKRKRSKVDFESYPEQMRALEKLKKLYPEFM
ncbi:TPA: hypothetical protein ACHSNL_001808 [Klebsiella variicola]